MTAPGPITALIVEVELTAGAWTDISSYVALESGVSIEVGRSNPTDDIAPSRCSLTLRNDDGRFTPNNVTSPLSPNWKRGKRVRVKTTKGSTVQRFVGTIVALAVILPAGDMSTGQVTVTAVDGLAALSRRVSASVWAEQVLAAAGPVGGGATAEVFDLSTVVGQADLVLPQLPSSPGAGQLNNLSPLGSAARVVSSFDGTGTLTFNTAPPELFIDGFMTFTPKYNSATSVISEVGPALTFPVRFTSTKQAGIWFRTTSKDADIANGIGGQPTIMFGFDGFEQLQLWLVLDSQTVAGSVFLNFNDTLVGSANQYNDGQWHSVVAFQQGANRQLYVDEVLVYNVAGTYSNIVSAMYGSDVSGNGKKGINGFTGDIGGIYWSGSTAGGSERYARPSRTMTVFTRWNETGIYAGTALVPTSGAVTGSDTSRTVGQTATSGHSVLDVGQELARTVGGYVWIPPATGNPTLVLPDALRLPTVAATVTLEQDDTLAAPAQWVDSVDVNPTRVTASSSFGSATAVDSVAEAGGERRDATVSTSARSVTDAGSVAAMVLGQSAILRVGNIGVDLVNAATDLYAAFWALKPGARIRVASLASGMFGVTYQDGYLQGWTETYTVRDGRGSSLFLLDLSPADSPVEAVTDDAEYGRASSDTSWVAESGSAIGNTGTGTIVCRKRMNLNADFETGISDWYGVNGTVAWENSVVQSGAGSLKFVTNAATDPNVQTSIIRPVIPGRPYVASSFLRADTARSLDLRINWFNAWKEYTGVSSAITATPTANTWTPYVLNATAPKGAYYANIGAVNNGAVAAGLLLYIDNAYLYDSGESWSTSSADYPLDVDWNGERCTINAAPSAPTGEAQTLTITTRGVAPTVARVHASNEPVEVWHSAAVTI